MRNIRKLVPIRNYVLSDSAFNTVLRLLSENIRVSPWRTRLAIILADLANLMVISTCWTCIGTKRRVKTTLQAVSSSRTRITRAIAAWSIFPSTTESSSLRATEHAAKEHAQRDYAKQRLHEYMIRLVPKGNTGRQYSL